jgi:hypothetical protein
VSDVDSIRAQYEPVTHGLLFRCEFMGNNAIHSGGSKTVKCRRNKELPHSSYGVIHATGQDAMRAGDSKRKGSANATPLGSDTPARVLIVAADLLMQLDPSTGKWAVGFPMRFH